ncbi:MAG: GLUG motif-containing protein [Planctomycetota bacterium]
MTGKTNRKTWRVIWVLLPVVLSGTVWATGNYDDGDGSPGNPFQINTPAQMDEIGQHSEDWDKCFILTADIDLSAYTGTSFHIIGTPTWPDYFMGVFDGNGHTISNFTYTSTGTDYIGIFRRTGGRIKDLGLINPNVDAGSGNIVGGLVGSLSEGPGISNCYVEGGSVSGTTNVGGLVGYMRQTISNCYATASVSGTTNVGGLVGQTAYKATIKNCYSEGSVSADDNVGGLVGINYQEVINCYSTASVSGTTKVGGLVGYGVPVCASFWDTQTSGQSTSGGGKGKTTAEMQMASTFIGWGGCGNEGVWVLDEGNDYPRLWWENKPGQPLPTESLSDFVAGAGTEEDPYLIETGEQMNLVGVFRCERIKHFKLTADIDLSAYMGTSFNMIGVGPSTGFCGVFDGNGHTISNFSYNSNNTDYIGIFGFLRYHPSGPAGVEIRDLGLIDPNVDAGTGNNVGSLLGKNERSITGCYVEGGSVSGNDYVGGLVGTGGGISNCSSNAGVSGHWYVGGLVGTGGGISNCSSNASVSGDKYVGGLVAKSGGISTSYSTGTVSGTGEVGGLVGTTSGISNSYSGGLVGTMSGGTISNCYSTGNVSGVSPEVGGLVGYKEAGAVTDSFYDMETSGQEKSDGGIGLPTAFMQMASLFTSIGWDFVGETANGTDDFWDICDGTNYPKLAWEMPVLGDFGCPDGVDWNDVAVLCDQWLLEELSWDVGPDDGDGIVNFMDWAIFASEWKITNDIAQLSDFVDQWLQTGVNYYIADIAPPPDGDGIVDLRDFAAQAAKWLQGP